MPYRALRPILSTSFARRTIAIGALLALVAAGPAASVDFVEFETGPVRPMARSASGTELYAVNTPDNQLHIFTVADNGLERGVDGLR